ncbi:class I adenylate-forming enzyme family protein [Stutzerimonas xanthomarina]|uniref:Acyl-CoA synthetase (AMP-forming)/AMP-acid ligase II n=2 Tax=Stutzerimonas xanthomarina TaxID=271420 RepID=A0A1M5SA54_9GAMM|nr:class I adenylate-forming enzyme family protein [Stutzerimonas xanthomarina]MCP9340087.1 acyl--CoA ligase [Stutzerimonas xanthomarina]SEH99271.1 Acyl-CoA synthetase (AMP-forming)/AMP-acid ligase II [Stutzerimonas xanthomarina]SHH35394.1 Acyl-CoA synthetase (AMP-forming)/AMP-acid ligase II [Stutzerimonas xanthomarina DSM 18231]
MDLSERPDSLDLDRAFAAVPDLIAHCAIERPDHPALVQDERRLSYAELDALMDRVAAALQRDGMHPGDVLAICAYNSIEYAVVFLGALRAGVAVAPLAPSASAESLLTMLADAAPRVLFLDTHAAQHLAPVEARLPCPTLRLDQATRHGLSAWLSDAAPAPVAIQPGWAFNIIYSSGTTGEPKGIVQSHAMRWAHVRRSAAYGYGDNATTLISTPLYSNTTLVAFLPTLALGSTVVLMSKFDAGEYLRLAQQHAVTHTMLVPVQYQRLMARDDFEQYDLSRFRYKMCTSAPFSAALKADVLARWPGGLVDTYGMTEGGGTCILAGHEYPDKLHTVGRPAEGHDIRVIDDEGHELPVGSIGEIVGHSPAMMTGYLNKPEKTAEAEWFDPSGKRFIRTGDVGRFDADGFLTLLDRKKDMIISGGFNLYPSDLEVILREHPAIADVAVVGVPSTRWGETPVAFVVLSENQTEAPETLQDWFNSRVGKTQRLARLVLTDELPRSAIGKVLKRELRDRFTSEHGTVD